FGPAVVSSQPRCTAVSRCRLLTMSAIPKRGPGQASVQGCDDSAVELSGRAYQERTRLDDRRYRGPASYVSSHSSWGRCRGSEGRRERVRFRPGCPTRVNHQGQPYGGAGPKGIERRTCTSSRKCKSGAQASASTLIVWTQEEIW